MFQTIKLLINNVGSSVKVPHQSLATTMTLFFMYIKSKTCFCPK